MGSLVMIYGVIYSKSLLVSKNHYFIKSKGFGIKPTIAGDYKLWTQFAKHSNLETYNIKIGRFRTWPGQDSQLRIKEYHKHSNIKFKFIIFRFIRLLISLIIFPYIYLKTNNLIKKK